MIWAVRLVLVPVTLVLIYAARQAMRGRLGVVGLRRAALLSLAMGALAIWPTLPSPGSSLMLRDPDYRDGVDSVEIVAGIQDSLPRLSDVSRVHSYPRGYSWIGTVGPSWLGYLPSALLSLVTGPLAAHNLGVGLHVALLALAAWALARALGIGPLVSLLAAAGAAFAPHVLSEVDSCSLDRLTLYLVPLFFLCLHRLPAEGRRYALFGGAALAALFYGQTYYGIYLAAALPLLLIPRLLVGRWRRRLGLYALLAAVAALLLAPGLYVLERSTAGTGQQRPAVSMSSAFAGKLLQPVAPDEIQQKLRSVHGTRDGMASAQDRLITAVSRSMPLEWVAAPMYMLSGNAAYWLLVLLAVLLSRDRRKTLLASYDVAVLLLLAMGPFARTLASVSSVPLPSYALMLWVPGFENLKSFGRYMLIASTISTVPLALGLHGALDRLRERRGASAPTWARGLAVAAGAFLLCFFHLPAWLMDHGSPLGPRRPGQSDSPLVTYPGPVVQRLIPPRTMAALDPGPVLVLPAHAPSAAMRINPLQAGMPVANSPGHGAGSWSWTVKDGVAPLDELRRGGVRYVVLYRGRDHHGVTEEFLDRHLERVGMDDAVTVWKFGDRGL